LLQLAGMYCDAINEGALPNISNAFTAVIVAECNRALEEGARVYIEGVGAFAPADTDAPLDVESLHWHEEHARLLESALRRFKSIAMGDGPAAAEAQAKLVALCAAERQKNEALLRMRSEVLCERLVTKLLDTFGQRAREATAAAIAAIEAADAAFAPPPPKPDAAPEPPPPPPPPHPPALSREEEIRQMLDAALSGDPLPAPPDAAEANPFDSPPAEPNPFDPPSAADVNPFHPPPSPPPSPPPPAADSPAHALPTLFAELVAEYESHAHGSSKAAGREKLVTRMAPLMAGALADAEREQTRAANAARQAAAAARAAAAAATTRAESAEGLSELLTADLRAVREQLDSTRAQVDLERAKNAAAEKELESLNASVAEKDKSLASMRADLMFAQNFEQKAKQLQAQVTDQSKQLQAKADRISELTGELTTARSQIETFARAAAKPKPSFLSKIMALFFGGGGSRSFGKMEDEVEMGKV
jgi:hypothetical protein